jgi:hypothetical protein
MNQSTSSVIGGRLRRSGRRFGLGAVAATALALGITSAASATAATTVNHAPIGHLDSVAVSGDSITLKGWAGDLDTPHNSIDIRANFSAGAKPNSSGTWIAHDPRPDVAAAQPALGPNHGFNVTFENFHAGPLTVCVDALDLKGSPNGAIGCQTVTIAVDHPAIGHLDSVKSVGNNHIEIRGWTGDLDTPNQAASINLLLGGANYGHYYNIVPGKAALARPDVAQANPKLGPNHGFDVVVAARPGTYPVCAYGFDTEINHYGGTKLGCINVTV